MAKRVWFVGDQAGSWTIDAWPDGYSLDQFAFEENKPARSSEINGIQQNSNIKLRDHIKQILTSGWTMEGAFHSTGVDNQIAMEDSWLNVEGITALHIGNPDQASAVGGLSETIPAGALWITLDAPSVSARTDLLFLEMWVQEVAAVGSTDNASPDGAVDRNLYKYGGVGNATFANTIYWTEAAVEPSRRLQLRWRIRAVDSNTNPDLTGLAAQAGATATTALTYSVDETLEGGTVKAIWIAGSGNVADAETLNSVDGHVYATPVALVARGANNPSIPLTAITDERVKARLQPGIQVDQTNIYPAISNDSDLDHLMPATFAYTGTVLGQFSPSLRIQSNAGSSLQATFDLSQATFAVKFTVVNPNTPEFVGLTAIPSSRVELTLEAPAANPSDVVVELHMDAGSAPGNSLGSATIPKEWITTGARNISIPLVANLNSGSSYWVVVKKTTTQVLIASATNAPGTFASSTDGSNYTPTTTGFGYSVCAGVTGDIVNVLINNDQVFLFEYDANENVIRMSEYFYPAQGTRRAYSRVVGYGYNNTLTSIT